jgi:hypothetical protein
MRTFASGLLAQLQARMSSTARLFEFTLPEIGATWYYTTRGLGLSYGGHEYVTKALVLDKREGDTGRGDTTPFTINQCYVEPLVTFVGRRYSVSLQVIVRDAYWTGSDWLAYIVAEGSLTRLKRGNYTIEATFKPLAAFTTKKAPGILGSRLDARALFGAEFGASLADWKRAGCTALSVAQNIIETPDAAKKADGTVLDPEANAVDVEWYKNGFIRYTRDVTGIDGRTESVTFSVPIVGNQVDALEINNSAFVLAYPPPLLAQGETFDAYAGYDFSAFQAETKFGNFDPDFDDDGSSDGFIGFPHMPTHNPVSNPVADA